MIPLTEGVTRLLEAKPSIDCYAEPFAGGLGAFMAVSDTLKLKGIYRVMLNDINTPVIELYKALTGDVSELINAVMELEAELAKQTPSSALKLHKTKDKVKLKEELANAASFYIKTRSEFNSLKKTNVADITVLSRLLFLLTHCFNGIYRENLSGDFNVPFNWGPKTRDRAELVDTIQEYADVFNSFKVEFYSEDYLSFISKCPDTSLIYLDPPYLNIDSQAENKYSKTIFGLAQQKELLTAMANRASWMYSNHNLAPISEALLEIEGVYLSVVNRRNTISSDGESRGSTVAEILAIKRG